jgi:hypothetical protein
MSDDNISQVVLEKINEGFRANSESFEGLRQDINEISQAVHQLNLEIVALKGNVAAVKTETTEARADVQKLEEKVAELEAKARELELSIEVAKSATPRHLPERVAVIESSLNSVKKFGWFMVTAFAGLFIKTIWDLTQGGG